MIENCARGLILILKTVISSIIAAAVLRVKARSIYGKNGKEKMGRTEGRKIFK